MRARSSQMLVVLLSGSTLGAVRRTQKERRDPEGS